MWNFWGKECHQYSIVYIKNCEEKRRYAKRCIFHYYWFPSPSWQKIHLQQISWKKEHYKTVHLLPQGYADADMMVLSGIMEDTGYEAQKSASMRKNPKPASKSSYFRSQKKLMLLLIRVVKEDCANYARNILDRQFLAQTVAGTTHCMDLQQLSP